MPQLRGRTLNSGKPRDIAHIELYRLDEGAWIATGETISVPSNLYFVEDEWCGVNDVQPASPPDAPFEQRLTATENLHGPFPEIVRTPLQEARHQEFVAGEFGPDGPLEEAQQ